MKKGISSIAAWLFTLLPLFCQTSIPDGTTLTGTLSLAGSPYIVEGLLTVPAGDTLVIEPGVEIRFKTGTDNSYSGDDIVDMGHLFVKGLLIAEGTPTSKIIFTRDGSSGNWGCIAFHIVADETSNLSYCKVEYADRIQYLEGTSYHGSIGVTCPGISIRNCIISDNNYSGIWTDDCTPEIINNVIANNQLEGIHLYSDAASDTTYIINNTIIGNLDNGLQSSWNKNKVVNCIFWNNGNSISVGNDYCFVSYSLVQENELPYSLGWLKPGDGMIYNYDPQLNADYSIQLNSPCINSGLIDTTYYRIPWSDLLGNNRFNLDSIDIGASESTADKYIILVAPNGGEGFTAGETRNITWRSNAGSVKLEYSSDDGSNWTDITSSTDNDGVFEWTIPGTESELYTIRISDVSDGSVADSCDNNFTVFSSVIPDGTILSGTLTLTNSPYTVNGLVTVPFGDTLVIEPGVEIRFKTGTDYNYDSDGIVDMGHLFVKGLLIAEGTPTSKIIFTRDGSSGNWGCIAFKVVADVTSSLNYCKVEYADHIQSLEGFSYFGAISANNAGIKIHNCIISDNNYRGIWTHYCRPELINNIVVNSQYAGIDIDYGGSSDTTYIINNTLVGNGEAGLDTKSTLCKTVNCILWNNGNSISTSNQYNYVSYSLVQEDVLTEGWLVMDEGMIFNFDPQLNVDYSIQLNSPCINSGLIDTTYYRIPWSDLLGNNRFNLDSIDIGASESTADKYIILVAPNGGEGFTAGETRNITWRSNAGSVKLEYSSDDGSNWTDITSSTDNDGVFEWTIPGTESELYTIRISDVSDGSVADSCDNNFTVFSSVIPDGTILSGTLTLANSPYTVNGLVTVPFGDTLVIEPGVEIRFKTGTDYSYASDGIVDMGHLFVKGLLIAEGTPTSKIIFTRDGSSGNWGCIAFKVVADETSSLNYCKVEYADHIQSLEGFSYFGAISANNAGIKIHNCIISNNNYRGIWTDDCRPELINNIVVNSQYAGIDIDYGGSSDTTYIINNTLVGNGEAGLDTRSTLCKTVNCILWNNGNSISTSNQYNYVSYSLVQEDVLTEGWLVLDNGIIYNFDPQLNADNSIRLNSPCINTGVNDTSHYNIPWSDALGNNRFNLGNIDIGASESPSNKYIHILDPNGSEGLFAGNNQNITWKSNASNVKLEYSSDNGGSWTDIIASTPNNGIYSWTVPSVGSTQFDLRISDASIDTVYDRCDANFTVFYTPPPDNGILNISSDSVDYGRIEVALSDTTFLIDLVNSGMNDLVIDSLNGLASPFSVNLTTPYSVLPDDTLQLGIFLDRSAAANTYYDSLLVYTSDVDTIISLEVFLYNDSNAVMDYDGNVYKTVVIGQQVWMQENLRTTHYSEGTAIPLVEDGTAWDNLTYTDKAYRFYDNDTLNRDIYGALYTWAAAMNGVASSDSIPSGVQGVCPEGWHFPSDSEWKELEMFLGMSQAQADATAWRGTDEGGKLKEEGTRHWFTPNTGATNLSGFTALPGGYSDIDGDFSGTRYQSYFWSSKESSSSSAGARHLLNSNSGVYRYNINKENGFSVRCVQDPPPLTLFDSLVAYYPFNDNANDESGNGNDGTVQGAILAADRFGYESSAFSFDGVDDYISTFDFSDNTFSISYWIKTQISESQYSFSNITNSDDGIGMFTGLGGVAFGSGGGTSGTTSTLAVGSIDDNMWHHIVGLYERTNNSVKIYIDNDLIVEESFSALIYSSTLYFGKRGSFTGANGHYYNGSIDDVRIYNRVLSDNDISQIFANYYSSDTFYIHTGDTQVTLYWDTLNRNYKDKYFIYRDNILIDSVNITSENDTSYIDSELVNYQEYSYFIRSKDIWGNMSISSDTFSASPCEIVTDYDGNEYKTTRIGDQIWLSENLKSLHYDDGSSLVDGTTAGDISGDYTTQYYFWYNNDSATNAGTYGALYTWAAAMKGEGSSDLNPSGVQGICPDRWHLPSDDEWKQLEIYLGMSQAEADGTTYRGTDEGGKLKESDTTHWNSPNTSANNSARFNAFPGGWRGGDGNFNNMRSHTFFSSATESNISSTWNRGLAFDKSQVYRTDDLKNYGFSVRCIKDLPMLTVSTDSIITKIEADATDTTFILEISNSGGSDLIIDSISVLNNPFNVALVTPAIIGFDDTLQLDITINRSYTLGEYVDNLLIYTSDRDTSILLEIFLYDSTNSVIDYDGNVYKTVMIGDQVWMRENLKTTHYSDGGVIPLVEDGTEWSNLSYIDEAYCYYDNNISNAQIYGALYTWPAAIYSEPTSDENPSGIQGACPDGWHLPSDSEWKELEMFLGMSQPQADGTDLRGTDEGGKMKEAGITHWSSPNTGATNSSGFTSLPGGYRYDDTFASMGLYAYFWSSTQDNIDFSWRRVLYYNNSEVSRNYSAKDYGFSVRCLKDFDYRPFLELTADTIDFGVIGESYGDTTQSIQLLNTYTDSIRIDSLSGVELPFSIELPDYPVLNDIGLAAGESTQLNITLSPASYSGIVMDTISIWINGMEAAIILSAEITTSSPPAVPTLLYPDNGASYIPTDVELTWNEVTDAVSYYLQVATDVAFSNLIIDDNELYQTSSQPGVLIENQTYYWRVSAGNGSGTSNWSPIRSFTTYGLIPPSLLEASAGNGELTLVWSKTDDPDFLRYRIYGTTQGATTAIDSTASINDTVITYTGLTDGQTYYYRITTVTGTFEESGFSNEESAIFEAAGLFTIPSNVSAISCDLSVILKWNSNPESNLSKYKIFKSQISPAYNLYDSVLVSANPDTVYVDMNVLPGQTLYYRITAEDDTGAVSGYSDEISVTIFNPVSLADDPETCSPGPVILDAGSEFTTYQWSVPDSSGQTLTVSSSGTYWVIATDAYGCVTSDTAIVTVWDLPPVDLGEDIIGCEGNPVLLDAGTDVTGYQWSVADSSNRTLTVTSDGTYWVKITDEHGCENSDTVSASFQTGSSPDLGADLQICPGNTVILDAGSGYTTYEWSVPDSSGQTLTISNAGTYNVTVTNSYGCTGNDTIEVSLRDLPDPDLGTDLELCEGTGTTLDAGAGFASYEWSVQDSANQTLHVTSAGDYWVKVTDAWDCSGYDTLNISALPNPIVDLGNDTSFCQGESMILDARSGSGQDYTAYLWSNGSTDSIISISENGEYWVRVTDENGCHGYDTIYAESEPAPDISIVSQSNPILLYDSTLLVATGATSYLWAPDNRISSTSGDSVFVKPHRNQVYTVTGNNEIGCTGSDSIEVNVFCYLETNNYLVDSIWGYIDFTCNERVYRPDNITSWILYPSGAESIILNLNYGPFDIHPSDTLRVFEGSDNTGRLLGEFNNNILPGDSIYADLKMFIEFTSSSSGHGNGFYAYFKTELADAISFSDEKQELRIYPNPFIESTIIEFPNPEFKAYRLIVMDLSGKVHRVSGQITGSRYELHREGLQNGFYIIELVGPNVYRGRIIIE